MCGCASANLLLADGWNVKLFEKEDYLGAGCRTFLYGGHPYTIGPRPLYTPYEKAVSYLRKFVKMHEIELYLNTYVERDNQFYFFPPFIDDILKMPDSKKINEELKNRPLIHEGMNFEEYYIASIGETLYNKFINNYSKKMWNAQSNTELTDFSWSLKGLPLKEGTPRIRADLIMEHPSDVSGYNNFFDCATEGAEVYLNTMITEFDLEKKAVKVNDEWIKGDILVSTASVDLLMRYRYGELRYIGREFMKLVLPAEHIIPDPILYLHYANDEKFTRIVEYKKLYHYESPTTLLGIEFPSLKNKMYPYPIKEERERAEKYLNDLPKNVFSMGRFGKYKYDNIGDVIMEAYEMMDTLK